jgi:hypothetical protein
MNHQVVDHLLLLAYGRATDLVRAHTYNKGVYGPGHENVGKVIAEMELNQQAIGELLAAKALGQVCHKPALLKAVMP